MDGLEEKKIIEWGWDEPDTKFMREHAAEMENYAFDGLIFHVTCYRRGQPVIFNWLQWSKERYRYREFLHAVEDLRATKFPRFTELCLRFNVCPGDVDWFNDDEWSGVPNNAKVSALIAKEGRCRGFVFDVEQYNAQLFNYKSQKHKDTKSFTEYLAKPRQRNLIAVRVFDRMAYRGI